VLADLHQLIVPERKRVMEATEKEALDIFGTTAKRLDERERTEPRPSSVDITVCR
jgi:hypothetical protein